MRDELLCEAVNSVVWYSSESTAQWWSIRLSPKMKRGYLCTFMLSGSYLYEPDDIGLGCLCDPIDNII